VHSTPAPGPGVEASQPVPPSDAQRLRGRRGRRPAVQQGGPGSDVASGAALAAHRLAVCGCHRAGSGSLRRDLRRLVRCVQLGFTDVFCFESGAQLLSSGAELHLVILDIVMPHPWVSAPMCVCLPSKRLPPGPCVLTPWVRRTATARRELSGRGRSSGGQPCACPLSRAPPRWTPGTAAATRWPSAAGWPAWTTAWCGPSRAATGRPVRAPRPPERPPGDMARPAAAA